MSLHTYIDSQLDYPFLLYSKTNYTFNSILEYHSTFYSGINLGDNAKEYYSSSLYPLFMSGIYYKKLLEKGLMGGGSSSYGLGKYHRGRVVIYRDYREANRGKGVWV